MGIVQVFIALVAAAVVTGQVFTNCATGSTDMTVTSVSINPYPICLSQQFCIKFAGSLSAPITFPANFTTTKLLFGTVVSNQQVNMCTLLAAQGTPCPVPTTATVIKVCLPAPPNTLPSGVTTIFSGINGNGNNLFCQASVNLQYISSPIPC